ncbi:MAG: NAD(P)/FAD-dependent oxidoreductase [bacterium]
MFDNDMLRRDFLKWLLGGVSMAAFDWSVLPKGPRAEGAGGEFDAVIIGSGLGGLSCAAAFARQGFKPLVLEMHSRPGGYATTFSRPGGFVFDVSLHSTTVGERDGVRNLIPAFKEITEVEFVPHNPLYRVIYPDYDIRVPQRDVHKYISLLEERFPEESPGIIGLIEDMQGLSDDIQRFMGAGGQVDMTRFPTDYPYLFQNFNKTWGDMVDARITNTKLRAVVSALWGYYGLPPSRLSSFYYALPTMEYLKEGGFYPRGRSQAISNALVKFIEDRGGKVLLKTRVERILVEDGAAHGVVTEDGKTYKGRAVVSNVNAHDTFQKMMSEDELLADYSKRMDGLSVSLSSFQVFLGLERDLVHDAGITDTEIFVQTGYDMDEEYQRMLGADVENGGFGITLYDNLYDGYSPEGKNTVNIMTLQGYGHWEPYAKDYWAGNKDAYNAEKERLAGILIARAEETLLPGLAEAIEVKEIGTPLTNVRYTANYRGAAYGWDQTVDNSGQNRVGHATPIKNLYLAGAWTRPGHGYSGVLWSGVECFGEIVKEW